MRLLRCGSVLERAILRCCTDGGAGHLLSPHFLAPVRDSKHIDQEVLKRYESVGGVRIEDVVLITKDGHENLTTVRSDTEWVEKVCSGEI